MLWCTCFICFFFFNQKTAYEVRISYWSSYLCSSDLLYERLGIIRTALGDFEPILGDIIRDIEIALVNPELSVEQRVIELDRSVLAAEQRKAERSEEHTSELQSLMRISYAVFCLKKKKNQNIHTEQNTRMKYN